MGCLEVLATESKTLDIGGADILNYQDLIDIYCTAAGLPRRIIIAVPILTPCLSAKWISWPAYWYGLLPIHDWLIKGTILYVEMKADIWQARKL